MSGLVVACVGPVTLEHVLEIDAPLIPGATHRAARLDEFCGGSAATSAATVVSLGGQACLHAQVGTDEAASRIMSMLDRAGIDRHGVHHIPQVPSATSTVIVTGDDRTVVNHTAQELVRGTATFEVVSSDVAAVLVDARWPDAAGAALRDANVVEIPAILDLDRAPDPEAAAWMAGLASHVAASQRGARTLVGADDPAGMVEAMSHFTDGARAVTDGLGGVWWSDGGEVQYTPSPDLEVVETVEAADVFHGALALALARGRPVGEAVQYATAATALRCSRRGKWDALPSGYDVDRLVETAWQ